MAVASDRPLWRRRNLISAYRPKPLRRWSGSYAALGLLFLISCFSISCDRGQPNSGGGERKVIDIDKTVERLQEHVQQLTVTIGERSVGLPENLEKTAAYIESFFQDIDLPVHRESYPYKDFTVSNMVANIDFSANPNKHYLLGAHYDSVWGTVGADDNASAIAVQLETARQLRTKLGEEKLDLRVKFVSFALEEPPVYGTSRMGS